MLPFQAEPLESMKTRLPKALEKVWEITNPMPDRPGLHRTHVFDFHSGMRLLISRDCLRGEPPDTHVSASWEWTPPLSIEEMKTMVTSGYRALGGKGTLLFIGFSSKAIPHFVVATES